MFIFMNWPTGIGVERIAKMASILGLGQLTGIDLPGEKSGLVPTRSWKQKTLGKSCRVEKLFSQV